MISSGFLRSIVIVGAALLGPSVVVVTGQEETATAFDICGPEHQVSHSFAETPLTLNYVVTATNENGDNGLFHGEVIYEGQGFVGFGVSPDGRMEASTAVLGFPTVNDISKYDMSGQTLNSMTRVALSRQTLQQESIQQNDTHTVLRFTKLLQEPNDVPIDLTTSNHFIVAGGSSNMFGYHGPNSRATSAFEAPNPCVVDESFGFDINIPTNTAADVPDITAPTTTVAAPIIDCTSFVTSHSFENIPFTLHYVVTTDENSENGLFHGELIYEGQGYVGFGISPDGGMENSIAVLGFPTVNDIAKYSMRGKVLSSIHRLGLGQQTLQNSFILQNETHTILRFTKLVEEANEISIATNAPNHFIVAGGSSNLFGYHGPVNRGANQFGPPRVCVGGGQLVLDSGRPLSVPQYMELQSVDEEEVAVPTPPPTEEQPQAVFEIDDDEEETTTGPAADDLGVQTAGDPIDCTQYQVSHKYENIPMTLDYVVNYDEETGIGNFSGRVTYEGQGYVSFAVSQYGRMVGSTAIIGLPDEPISEINPGIYTMDSTFITGVLLAPEQTLLDANIVQNDTHTVLTFTKLLEEPGHIPINLGTPTFFLVAAGRSNRNGNHIYRDAVGLTAVPCRAESEEDSDGGGLFTDDNIDEEIIVVNTESHQELFLIHGIIACIAWGILAPLAIGNSVARCLIPGHGFWFKVHRNFNICVLILTIVCFGLAVAATREGHFQSAEGPNNKHRVIGLVVFILVIIQSIGGAMRPPKCSSKIPKEEEVQEKQSDGSEGVTDRLDVSLGGRPSGEQQQEQPTPTEEGKKSTIRNVWEFVHYFSGYLLLALAWYQCHSGLVKYSELYQANDFSYVFWIVTGICSILIVVGSFQRISSAAKK